MQRSRNLALTICGVLLANAADPVRADPTFDYTAGIGIEHSDNINLSATDPISQNVLIPTFTFGTNSKGSALEWRTAGAFEYHDYLGGAYGSELRSLVSGIADWHISPRRLDWVVEDYLGRQPINTLESDAPSNQQQTNVFSTGPTLQGRLGAGWRSQLDLRYSNSHADESSEFNSNRYSATEHLLYDLNPVSLLGVNVATSRVRYVEDVSKPFDYDRNDVYGSYKRTTRQFDVLASAGYSELDLGRLGDRSGPLLRATAHWNPSPRDSIGVTVQREYADASQDLVIDPSLIGNVGIGTGLNGTVITPQVYIEKYLGLDFSHNEERFRVGVAPFVRRRNYIEGDFPDEWSRGGYLDGRYSLAQNWDLGGFGGLERRRYTLLSRTDNDKRYGVSLSWRETQHLLWALSATRTERDSNAELSSYTENALFLSLVYKR